jgi:hypothetical protein
MSGAELARQLVQLHPGQWALVNLTEACEHLIVGVLGEPAANAPGSEGEQPQLFEDLILVHWSLARAPIWRV